MSSEDFKGFKVKRDSDGQAMWLDHYENGDFDHTDEEVKRCLSGEECSTKKWYSPEEISFVIKPEDTLTALSHHLIEFFLKNLSSDLTTLTKTVTPEGGGNSILMEFRFRVAHETPEGQALWKIKAERILAD